MKSLHPRGLALFVFTLILAACTYPAPAPLAETAPAPAAAVSPSPSLSPSQPVSTSGPAAQPTDTLASAPEPVALPDPQYVITATLNYGGHHLEIQQEIIYHNRTDENIPELVIIVEPRYYFPDPFTLHSLKWEDGQEITGYRWDEKVRRFLHLPLPSPLPPGGRLALSLSYALNLPSPSPSPEVRPVPFGYTQAQTNLVDWYAMLPPYLPGKGWILNEAWYFGEHLAYEKADFRVNFRLEDDRPELAVASSAPEQREGAWRRYKLENARNFALSVSHQYVVTTQSAGPVTLIGYAFPAHAAEGEAVLKATAEAMGLYSELFGPYPHTTLSLVEAAFLDGMEYEGLYFLSNGFYNLYQGTPGEYLIAIAVHETAHQWWYGLVGNDQAHEPWLDEALCTYAERIYFERLHPEALDWWWNYRVQYYQPAGWVDSSIYASSYRAYRDAVYLNGAVFLGELRHLVGDETFFATLRAYAVRHANGLATAQDFFSVLQEHSSADLSPLIKTYFQTDPRPVSDP
jgi:hypothetical protein